MNICLVAEGCYPYVAGGVSSWIQMLVNGMPQHSFSVFAIGAEKKMKGQYKYKLSDNVKKVHEHFLDEAFESSGRFRNVKISRDAEDALLNLFSGGEVRWEAIFDQFSGPNASKPNNFLRSDSYLRIITRLCSTDQYRNMPFKDVFWTIRSMLMPLLNLLSCPIPEADEYHSVSTGYAGMMASLFRYRTGKPFILTEHGIYSREREEEILKSDWVENNFKKTWIDFFGAMCRCSYNCADRIVSLFYGARDIQIALGAPAEKCIVIPNGISLKRFAPVPEISLEPHPLSVGAIIRVVPIKDLKTMIQAFALLKVKRPDAHLYMIGPTDESPEYYGECQELIAALEVQDIEFVGRVDVSQWMGRLDMVILTSISEGQPFVLLEAMAAHRPVLATNVGSCKEIIEGYRDDFGPAGVVTPVMNPPRIAEGMLRIGKNPTVMRAMAQNGYNRVAALYQDKDFLARYHRLYEEVSPSWQASASS